MEYYSETMIKDLREAAATAPEQPARQASPHTGSH
jgi:hypothetical protein